MNIKLKKYFPLFAAGVMLLQLAGCGKEEKNTDSGQKQTEEYAYTAEYYELSQNGYPANSAFFGTGDELYYVGVTKDDKSGLFSRNIGEGEGKEIPIELEEDAYLSGIFKGPEGSILANITIYGEEAGSIEKLEIRKLSPDGGILEAYDATNSLGRLPDPYVQAMAADDKGNYYACIGQSVYVINPNTDLFFEIPAGSYVSNMFVTKSGEVLVCYQANIGFKIEQVDLAQKSLKAVESNIVFDYGTYQAGESTDLLYTQNSILYRCNWKDEKPEQILKWVDCNIESTYIKDIKELSDGNLAVITVNWSNESEAELAVLTRKKRSEIQEKTVITYGSIYLPYFTDSDIVAFNKQSDTYRIEVKEYGDENMDLSARADLLNADIANGNGPDMIDLRYSSMSLDQYVSMGILEDLTPWLQKDKELKPEDFVESALEAFAKDGKLYGITPSFSVQTLIGKASDLGERSHWTVEEMMQFMESQPRDRELIADATRDSILWTLCSLNQEEFISSETGECSFTKEEFVKILEFSAGFPKEINYGESALSPMEKIGSGEAVLLEDNLSAVSMYQLYEEVFKEEVTFIGLPTADAGGGFTIASNGTLVGMNAASANKEGVWEFIRFNLTRERQEKTTYASGGFPIRKDVLEKQFEKDMMPEYYEDGDGNQKEQPKSYWSTGTISVEVYAATQEQVDQVKEIIESARGDSQMQEQVWQIIYEEAQPYFEGQKTAREAAELIQSRAQIFVNESR